MLTKQPIVRKLTVPAERVWDAIRSIGRLDVWFPFIEICRVEGDGPGALRFMTIANNGGEIQDTIESIDDTERRLVYRRPVSPFPVTDYTGTVEVFTSYDGLGIVVWTIDFESKSKDATGLAELVYGAITDGIEGMEKDLMTESHMA